MAEPMPTIVFRRSVWQLLKLVGLGLIMTGGSAFLIWLSWTDGDVFKLGIGAIGTLFFGACLGIAAWRAVTAGQAAITLTATGLRDPRVARDEIPWTALENVTTWSHQGQDIMVLSVKPEVEATLGLTAMARWSRKARTRRGRLVHQRAGARSALRAAAGYDVEICR